ncbi:MAG: GTP-binding protein [Candidatus Woesearchaeota archaeon]
MVTNIRIVGGMLGSGKTTFITQKLLPYYAKQGTLDRLLCIINDAASGFNPQRHNTDTQRILQRSQLHNAQIASIEQTCVCCDGVNEFIDAIQAISPEKTSEVLIEPTGIASISSMVDYISDIEAQKNVRLKDIIYMLPSSTITHPISHDGLSHANGVVISWADLMTEAELAQTENFVRNRNAHAHISYLHESHDWSDSLPPVKRKTHYFMPSFSIRRTKLPHTNSHSVKTRTFALNPYTIESKPELLEDVLNKLVNENILRAKGYRRVNYTDIQEFDIAQHRVKIHEPIVDRNKIAGNGSLEVIATHLPKNLERILEPVTENVGELIALKGSPLKEMVSLYTDYEKQTRKSLEQTQYPITLNFESADVQLALAKQIVHEHHTDEYLKKTLPIFFATHMNALDALDVQPQKNSSYVGSMIGLKLLYELTEFPQYTRYIEKEHIAQQYLHHRSHMTDTDKSLLAKNRAKDEYILYLDQMDTVARQILGDKRE